MRLSAKLIQNFNNINSFGFANQWMVRAGDQNTLYFQLVDLDQPQGRYLPGIGSSNQPYGVIVTFPSIDDTKIITAIATQVNANDASVWQLTISSSQTPASGQVVFAVSEGTATRRFGVIQAIQVEYPGQDGCDSRLPNGNY